MPYNERRLDRHIAHLWIHGALASIALGFCIAPVANPALKALSVDTQVILGACMGVGSFITLIGAATGARWFFPNTDRRTSYAIGVCGLISVAASMFCYSYALIQYATFVQALGGGLSVGIGGMSVQMIWLMCNRIRRMTRIRAKIRDRIEAE